MAKSGFGLAMGGAAFLAACALPSQPDTSRDAVRNASPPSIVGKSPEVITPPVFVVNELLNGLIPLAPQMGKLSVRDGCIVFTMSGRVATPLWPAGSTLERSGNAFIVNVAGDDTFRVPSAATLGGAFVPLNSKNMTKYSKPLPRRCPDAIFAVARQ